MRALQEKLTEVENENKFLRETLYGKDGQGKEKEEITGRKVYF